jgi:hypothetical protein
VETPDGQTTEMWIEVDGQHKRVHANKVGLPPGMHRYRTGDLVMVHESQHTDTRDVERKLAPTWTGPYRIATATGNSYMVTPLHEGATALKYRVHTDRL